MKGLYPDKKIKSTALKAGVILVCMAAYSLCCLASFRAIGNVTMQFLEPILLSGVLTVGIFFFLPSGLDIMSKALNGFLGLMVLSAIYEQIVLQIHAGHFGGWIYTFFYDRPLTVALVWGVAFASVTFFRTVLPYSDNYSGFRKDFYRFFSATKIGFLVFYVLILIYCFVLLRSPGERSEPNYIPFVMIKSYFHSWNFAYESIFYLIGNLLCFFPLGFYFRASRKKPNLVLALVLPIILSFLIEESQLLFRTGDFDVDDIIMNAFGFYVGFFLSFLLDLIRKAITKGQEKSIFERID